MAVLIFAHRGFSGREPEHTHAAYLEAIAWSARSGVELGLECDVQFSADDQVICLHDLDLDRTSNASGPAYARRVEELRELDFGRWRLPSPTPRQRRLITLEELLDLVAVARSRGVPVSLAIETKHPNPRGLELEERVAAMLQSYGWTASGSPVRLLSFSLPALLRFGVLLPTLQRTLLVERELGAWSSGELPDGVRVVGPDLLLIKQDPGFVERARSHGNHVHVWTVNEPADVALCRRLGVAGITTDDPERVVALLEGRPAP